MVDPNLPSQEKLNYEELAIMLVTPKRFQKLGVQAVSGSIELGQTPGSAAIHYFPDRSKNGPV